MINYFIGKFSLKFRRRYYKKTGIWLWGLISFIDLTFSDKYKETVINCNESNLTKEKFEEFLRDSFKTK